MFMSCSVRFAKQDISPRQSFFKPHVIPNLYDFLSSVEHKGDILTDIGKQVILEPISKNITEGKKIIGV